MQRKNAFTMKMGGNTIQEQPNQVINVTIELKSYKQHSDLIKEICSDYKNLVDQNKTLRERLNTLKMQHDKETNVSKYTQFMIADKDMKFLQEWRLKRNKERQGGIPDRSDDTLEDNESKIVPVEWFNSLEGIDPELQ